MTFTAIAEMIFGKFKNIQQREMREFRLRIKLKEFDEHRDFIESQDNFNALDRLLGLNGISTPDKRSKKLRSHINLIPGTSQGACREQAMFVSKINSSYASKIKLGNALTFDQILERVVMHCQGKCFRTTTEVYVITDNISSAEMNKWAKNLQVIQKHQGVEISIFYVNNENHLILLNEMMGLSPF